MFDVVVVGSLNLDLVATTSRLPRPGETVLGTGYAEHAGGKGLNQAVAAARHGVAVALIGAVGDDEAGRRLLDLARRDGVDVEHVATVSEPTGRAVITVDEHAENSIVVVPGANSAVGAGALPSARLVAAQLEVPVAAVGAAFESGRAEGALTLLNPAPGRPLPRSLLQLCDVVVPNEHELDQVGGVDELLAAGVGVVVTTRGAAGVDVATPRTRWNQAAFPVAPVDTTGAGDAFCGALAAQLSSGTDLAEAVRHAAAAGALATTTAGAVPSLPTGAAVEQLLTSEAV